jgi:O-antigen ligase
MHFPVKKASISTIIILAVVAVMTYVAFTTVGVSAKLFMGVFAVVAFGIAFVNTQFALIVLVFSMLLSPELSLGAAGNRDVMIRADDVILGVILVGWLARMAVNKDLALFKATPMNGPIFNYMAVCAIATIWGMVKGSVTPINGCFYTLKYFEYFLLFFMVYNTARDAQNIRYLLRCMIVVFVLISLYAWYQHHAGVDRASTPFEGQGGEANTLGGYCVLMLMYCLSLFLHGKNPREKVLCLAGVVLGFPALLFTLSRGAWVAVVPALAMFWLLTKRGKVFLLIVAAFAVLGATWLFPRNVQERFTYTFDDQRTFTFFGKDFTVDESTAARIDAWQIGYDRWRRAPVWGLGVGSVGAAVDNQFTRIFVETGVVGFIFFVMVFVQLFNICSHMLRRWRYDEEKYGLVAGFYSGIVGMVFLSFSMAPFIIIRIAEPFWFMAAGVAILAAEAREQDALEEENEKKGATHA